MHDNLYRVNFAIKPSSYVASYVANFSRKLSLEAESNFTIDNIEYFPHITLFAPVINHNNLSKIVKIIENEISKHNKLTVYFSEIQVGQGYIGIKVNLSKEIEELKEHIVNVVEKFIERDLPDKLQNAKDYNMYFSNESLASIRKYSSVSMQDYQPHLTIIRIKDEQKAIELSKRIKWDIDNFIATTIAIYKMGKNGTCQSILKELKLK